jgi:hypothetical protein
MWSCDLNDWRSSGTEITEMLKMRQIENDQSLDLQSEFSFVSEFSCQNMLEAVTRCISIVSLSFANIFSFILIFRFIWDNIIDSLSSIHLCDSSSPRSRMFLWTYLGDLAGKSSVNHANCDLRDLSWPGRFRASSLLFISLHFRFPLEQGRLAIPARNRQLLVGSFCPIRWVFPITDC